MCHRSRKSASKSKMGALASQQQKATVTSVRGILTVVKPGGRMFGRLTEPAPLAVPSSQAWSQLWLLCHALSSGCFDSGGERVAQGVEEIAGLTLVGCWCFVAGFFDVFLAAMNKEATNRRPTSIQNLRRLLRNYPR